MPDTPDIAAIAAKLTKAQRDTILGARRQRDKWALPMIRASTRTALAEIGLAEPWGVVSADLSALGEQVLLHLLNESQP